MYPLIDGSNLIRWFTYLSVDLLIWGVDLRIWSVDLRMYPAIYGSNMLIYGCNLWSTDVVRWSTYLSVDLRAKSVDVRIYSLNGWRFALWLFFRAWLAWLAMPVILIFLLFSHTHVPVVDTLHKYVRSVYVLFSHADWCVRVRTCSVRYGRCCGHSRSLTWSWFQNVEKVVLPSCKTWR